MLAKPPLLPLRALLRITPIITDGSNKDNTGQNGVLARLLAGGGDNAFMGCTFRMATPPQKSIKPFTASKGSGD